MRAFAATEEGKGWLRHWMNATQHYFPAVMEEIKGLASGAEIELETVSAAGVLLSPVEFCLMQEEGLGISY